MIKIVWEKGEKEREWAFAKEKLIQQGKLLPNGYKLRRNNFPQDLNHSFIVIDDRILALSGKGNYLGRGSFAGAKLAEDEEGNLFALKIIKRVESQSALIDESLIAMDLGIAGQIFRRANKHYIAYQYLGNTLKTCLSKNHYSLDKRYELSIKISLALHDLHAGNKSKSKNAYEHNDISLTNITIDEQDEPHFIDFGRSSRSNYPLDKNKKDIVDLLLLFYVPSPERNNKQKNWIFGNWIGEYRFFYTPIEFDPEEKAYDIENKHIHLYLNLEDKNKNGVYSLIHFAVLDLFDQLQTGVIDLSELGLQAIQPRAENLLGKFDFNFSEKSLIENKVWEIAMAKGFIAYTNETLNNLLKDPRALYYTPTIPSALDIAETLTLSRFKLELFQNSFTGMSVNERLKAIHLLNSESQQLLEVYEKLPSVKEDLICSLIRIVKTDLDSAQEEFHRQLKIFHSEQKIPSPLFKGLHDKIAFFPELVQALGDVALEKQSMIYE